MSKITDKVQKIQVTCPVCFQGWDLFEMHIVPYNVDTWCPSCESRILYTIEGNDNG